jgi:hypothetical protein
MGTKYLRQKMNPAAAVSPEQIKDIIQNRALL